MANDTQRQISRLRRRLETYAYVLLNSALCRTRDGYDVTRADYRTMVEALERCIAQDTMLVIELEGEALAEELASIREGRAPHGATES